MDTPHDTLLSLISALAKDDDATFASKCAAVIDLVFQFAPDDFLELLGECGFIPEAYEHDSSEEKVYAKAMDAVIASAFQRLGYNAEVTVERSNAADALAWCDGGTSHSGVLDAKAFRLSRTALNPKDYKIEALNTWRNDHDYACLVAPLAGFPRGTSRLYEEAIRFDVTLITFSHLRFLLECEVHSCERLELLWKGAREVAGSYQKPTALDYWRVVDEITCRIAGSDMPNWRAARREYFDDMLKVADKQIAYFEAQKQEISSLPHEALVVLAVEALKLNNKVATVAQKKQWAGELIAEIDEAERS